MEKQGLEELVQRTGQSGKGRAGSWGEAMPWGEGLSPPQREEDHTAGFLEHYLSPKDMATESRPWSRLLTGKQLEWDGRLKAHGNYQRDSFCLKKKMHAESHAFPPSIQIQAFQRF